MTIASALAELNTINMKIDLLRNMGRSIEFKVNAQKNDEDVFCWFKLDDIPLTFTSPEETLAKLDRLLGA